MAIIEGFRIQNYRCLKDITMGRIGTDPERRNHDPLTPLVAVIGRNGTGKSTIFDAFGFLADCMEIGVEAACNNRMRGGFLRMLSAGCNPQEECITFTIYYREAGGDRPITYELSIGYDAATDSPLVVYERFRKRRADMKSGRPLSFLLLEKGQGTVWIPVKRGGKTLKQIIQMVETNEPAISILAKQSDLHPDLAQFRNFIKGWYLSYFIPNEARRSTATSVEPHLNTTGSNLSAFVRYLQKRDPQRLRLILDRISTKIPGIGQIDTYEDPISRIIYLQFQDKGFNTPFYALQMSDGTLKLVSYMLLLEDPEPHPFICIEEPENGLHHKLLHDLAVEFRKHTENGDGTTQLFITTHQPHFVNALTPQETWLLTKGADGFSTISRASDDQLVVALTEEELPLGDLWYSDYLDE